MTQNSLPVKDTNWDPVFEYLQALNVIYGHQAHNRTSFVTINDYSITNIVYH